MTKFHVEFDIESNSNWYNAINDGPNSGKIKGLPMLQWNGLEVWVPSDAKITVVKDPLPAGVYAIRAANYETLHNVYFRDVHGQWYRFTAGVWHILVPSEAAEIEQTLTLENKLPDPSGMFPDV